MTIKTVFAAVAAVTFATGAHAASLDFEGFAAGTKLTSFNVGGVTGTITATGGSGDAMVFDSGNFSGGDSDLGVPFFDAFTGGSANGTPAAGANTLDPGNILIVSEDGNSANPDDNGNGGMITFDFDQAITFTGFDVFDDVTDFSVTANQGDSITGITLDYNNQFQSFTGLDWANVTTLVFDFANSSGAIDNIQFEVPTISAVPVPASLPLLLAGFGVMGFVSRRRAA